MRLVRATSIQRKLTLLVMITTAIALLVAAAQFVINDVRDYHRRIMGDLRILAHIIGDNCISSIDFDRPDEAAATLSALQAKPHVLAAAVYRPDGTLFASYAPTRQGDGVPQRVPGNARERFLDRQVGIVQPVLKKSGVQVGSIYLSFDLVELWSRVGQDCLAVALMLVVSGLVAFFVTARLQRVMTKPILDLAEVANVVSEKRDYSVRAAKQTDDEIGFLIDCFNGMLARIEQHEKKLREVNEELARSEHRARAATEAKSQFLANMSHELRTPLNAIIGYAEIVQEELEDAGQERFISDLKKIHGAARHQLSLINDILDLSKIEAGKMQLFVEDFDLAAMVQDVATTIRPLVLQHKNQLTIDCPQNLGTMRADQTKVRQVLFNLLSNATKFTENGHIELKVSRFEPLDLPGQSPTITFTITDTGIGMSAEQLGRLFQAFSQAENSTTRKFGGTGLGLAISRRFCQMMGGELAAVSQPGKGSTFTVTLPVSVAESSTGPHEPDTPIRPDTGASAAVLGSTILVIDDEASARDLLKRALNKEGYAVETAASGPEGIALARRLKPAAITLDVMMPGMDGWAVLSSLKGDPATADIPVVMTTVVDDKNLGFALGAAEYLIKPIEWDRLIAVLEKVGGQQLGARMLIVEDEPQTREMLRRAAERQGWHVLEADNGRTGLQRVAEQVPAVILLDLMMPEMDGFAFLEHLRRQPGCRHLPVVVVTAKDLTDEDRRRLNGDVIKVLQKGGFSTREVLEEVRQLLGATLDRARDI